ncbi:hypothetical protein ACFL3V_07165 [Nanoarchaeota archaeon]
MLHEIYFLMFQLIMIFMVAIALFQYTNNVATDLGFEKRYASIDVGLLTTAVMFTPGTLKQDYRSIDFGVPMDFIFANSLVNIKERGKELNKYYWFLSDRSLEPFEEDVQLESSASNGTDFTYYKSGRSIDVSKDAVNPLQQACPLVGTSDTGWKSKKFFIAKVLPKRQDYADANLSVNRIAQILSARYSYFTSGSGAASQPAGGSLVSAIPGDAELVIVLGDSGEKREPGSLVLYIPVDDKILKSRKLACFILNDLLTASTDVYYAQVMPVFTGALNNTSPLGIFKERSDERQIMVFIDVSKFTNDQVVVDSVANAINRAVGRYYGEYGESLVPGATFSFSAAQASSPTPGSTSPTPGSTPTPTSSATHLPAPCNASGTPPSNVVDPIVFLDPQNNLARVPKDTFKPNLNGRPNACRGSEEIFEMNAVKSPQGIYADSSGKRLRSQVIWAKFYNMNGEQRRYCKTECGGEIDGDRCKATEAEAKALKATSYVCCEQSESTEACKNKFVQGK